MLQFSPANSKLRKLQQASGKVAYSFDIPAGYTCPFAKQCQSRCENGKIKDGKDCKYRCYAASEEIIFVHAHNMRMRNWAKLKAASRRGIARIVRLIEDSLPIRKGIVRIHSSGDFYSEKYFLAWIQVCEQNANIDFYAYTKCILWWAKHRDRIPPNMNLIASLGGKQDKHIAKYGFRTAKVVFNRNTDLPINDDDYIACYGKEDFALLIHGIQPKGSKLTWRGKYKE